MKKVVIRKDSFNLINFIGLTIAGVINAIGAILFLFPLHIYDSGISGLSMLLDQVTPPFLTISMFLVLINFPIFLFGLKRMGKIFAVYSLYAIAIYSLTAFVFTTFIDLSNSPIVQNETLLAAIFGGLISGIGSGLTIKFGGAMDGIDVLSVMFSKKIGLSVGNFVLVFNVILYIIAGFVMSNWILPLYSIIAYFIGSETVDYVVEGFSRSKCALIVTNKASEICDRLSEEFSNSGTIVQAQGGYSKQSKEILYFNVNHFQIPKLKKIVNEIDKSAYITIQDVSDIIKAK